MIINEKKNQVKEYLWNSRFFLLQLRVIEMLNEALGQEVSQKELEVLVRAMAKHQKPRAVGVVIKFFIHYMHVIGEDFWG